jgi:iron complex outermembrane receptor protein
MLYRAIDRVVLRISFLDQVELPAAGTPAAQLNALFDSANATAATFFATIRSNKGG